LRSKYFTAKRFHLPERANFVAYLLYGRYAERGLFLRYEFLKAKSSFSISFFAESEGTESGSLTSARHISERLIAYFIGDGFVSMNIVRERLNAFNCARREASLLPRK
jgi:hypothetical protein